MLAGTGHRRRQAPYVSAASRAQNDCPRAFWQAGEGLLHHTAADSEASQHFAAFRSLTETQSLTFAEAAAAIG